MGVGAHLRDIGAQRGLPLVVPPLQQRNERLGQLHLQAPQVHGFQVAHFGITTKDVHSSAMSGLASSTCRHHRNDNLQGHNAGEACMVVAPQLRWFGTHTA